MSQYDDHLYAKAEETVAPFRFDAEVADVFADMIKRSVPGYLSLMEDVARIIQTHTSERATSEALTVVDLGCSLGAMLQVLAAKCTHLPLNCVGIDNSEAMLNEAVRLWVERDHAYAGWIEADLTQVSIPKADVIILNFTLQFIEPAERDDLMRRIYQALNSGGICIVSEKIQHADPALDALIIGSYHRFKYDQGYSDLEISQKRQALENVLIPETLSSHEARFIQSGFAEPTRWFQRLNFCSWLLVK